MKYSDILILWSKKKLEFPEKQETQFTQGCLAHTVLAGECPKPIGNKDGRKTLLEPVSREDVPLLLLAQESLLPSCNVVFRTPSTSLNSVVKTEKQGEMQLQLCGPFLTSSIQGHEMMMHPPCKLCSSISFPHPAPSNSKMPFQVHDS